MSYTKITYSNEIGKFTDIIRKEDQDDCTWVLFGIKGKNTNVEVFEKGNDYEELVDEFIGEPEKILFAYYRYKYDNCMKYVLFSWCHKSFVKRQRFYFINKDTEEYVQKQFGYHAKIDATSEKELDEEFVFKAVQKAGGATYVDK